MDGELLWTLSAFVNWWFDDRALSLHSSSVGLLFFNETCSCINVNRIVLLLGDVRVLGFIGFFYVHVFYFSKILTHFISSKVEDRF